MIENRRAKTIKKKSRGEAYLKGRQYAKEMKKNIFLYESVYILLSKSIFSSKNLVFKSIYSVMRKHIILNEREW